MKNAYASLLLISCLACTSAPPKGGSEVMRIQREMEDALRNGLLDRWYPESLDREYGGFLSAFTFDFKPTGEQDKMIVSQARHVWNNAKAMQLYPDNRAYAESAEHGFTFLRNVMWDSVYGGFHTLVSRSGTVKSSSREEKTAYGNAFGIYACAAYAAASGDTSALGLAKKAFMWLERNSHDPERKGYYQHMTRSGGIIGRDASVQSTAETGFKDQNSSIHLLEAFTELYQVWPDRLVAERLEEMLLLIRDRIVQPQGYMALFFTFDWTPVSYRDSSVATVKRHLNLDHVSFGHDVETAYLLLEAAHVLGKHDDDTTHVIAKKMVDHALENGWDTETGGFYDAGYYFPDSTGITIMNDTKNWWTQAEGLNTLLMMADLYPDDEQDYYGKFRTLWNYTNEYLIDHENGEWYAGGLDKEPRQKSAMKGHIWKAAYHQVRSLMNCIERLDHRPDQ